MRVLLFRMLCDRGGVSSIMLLLGQEMAKRGIDSEYWFCKSSSRYPEFQETGCATLAPLSKLAARLERGDFDVVQMTASDPAAEVVAMMARSAKVLVSAHGALSDNWNKHNCFAYSAISQGMARVNQQYTDVEIEVVRNAIDVERFTLAAAPAGDGPIVAFVGRSTDPIKDFPRFTRIAKRLARRGARIWIADPHNAKWATFDGQPVERIAPERWGMVLQADMPDFYRAVAASGGVVLMTSRSEGFGNVAPEAAACGAWAVAPNVLGLNEAVIDGITGNLFPADASDDEAAELIAEWMSAPHDRDACSHAARTEFSPSAMMDGYERIYRQRDQRIVTPTPRPQNDQSLSHLHEDLANQREWRASVSREAAVELAANGYPKFALGALAIAFRAQPRQFFSGAGLRQLVSTVRRIPTRRVRQ